MVNALNGDPFAVIEVGDAIVRVVNAGGPAGIFVPEPKNPHFKSCSDRFALCTQSAGCSKRFGTPNLVSA